MIARDLLRGRTPQILLWLVLAASLPELLLLLTATITVISRDEAERNAAMARLGVRAKVPTPGNRSQTKAMKARV
jgi:hypothetical protein